MEKYENFIAKIRFQYVGLDAFNRQQLAAITNQELDEKIELRIGNEITILGVKSKIVELVFSVVDNFEPFEKSLKIFSEFDTSENNCVLTVFLEPIE